MIETIDIAARLGLATGIMWCMYYTIIKIAWGN